VAILFPASDSFETFNSDLGEVVSAVEGTALAQVPALILPISLTNEVPQKDEEYFVTYCRQSSVNTRSVSGAGREKRGKYLEQFPMVFFPRLRFHRHSFVDGVCDLLRVPRVDYDTSVQTLGGTGELRQDHHALSILLASDVLVRDLRNSGKSPIGRRTE
jgi:hypothetical protein